MPSQEWQKVPLRSLLVRHYPGDWGEEPTDNDANALVLRSTNLDNDGHVDLSTGAPRRISAIVLADKQLKDGDILLEASGGGPGKPVGRVALFQQAGNQPYLCSNFFRTLRIDRHRAEPAYIAYLLHWLHGRPEIMRYQQQTTGIINLRYSDYLDQKVPVPSLSEQQRITGVLDCSDLLLYRQEDVLRKKRMLFSALAESLMRKASNHPSRPLRSIIESAVDGPFGSNLKSEHYVDTPGTRVVRLQNIGTRKFLDNDRAYVENRHASALSRHEVHPGDLLIASLGDERHPIARACIYPRHLPPGIVKADCFRMRTNPYAASNYYVMQALNSSVCAPSIKAATQGVTRDRINLGSLLSVSIPVPPPSFQSDMEAALEAEAVAIDAAEQELAKLRVARQGLMDDLLTRLGLLEDTGDRGRPS